MKTLLRVGLVSLSSLMLALGAVHAQPGPGMGPGAGMGPGGGMGSGAGPGWRMNRANTPGYTLMTQEERIAHRNRMRSLQNYDECVAYVGEHHGQMLIRAQEKGVTLPAPRNACDRFKTAAQ